MVQDLTAEEIKKNLIAYKESNPRKPIESCEFAGVPGWLWKSGSYTMEGWREWANHENPKQRKLAAAKMVQISFRDKTGKCVWDDKDLAIIGGFDDDIIRPIFNAALRINGYGPEGAEAILKNLLATFGADGLFDSLANINVRCPVCSKSTRSTNSGSNGSPSSTGRAAKQPQTSEPS